MNGRRRARPGLASTVIGDFWAHGCVTHGAALAFYALFVLVPVPIFVVSGAAALIGDAISRAEVVEVLRGLTGEQVAALLAQALDAAGELPSWRSARLFGLASLLFGATTFFVELQDTLNKIWDVPVAGFRWRDAVRSRLLSFVMVAGLGGVLVALTLVGVTTRSLGSRLETMHPKLAPLVGVGSLLVGFLVIFVLFSLVFRYLPDAEVSFREVWPGSLATAVLFVCGNELVGLYLRYASLATAYGAAGSLVLALTWVYYSALVFLFGAELTRALGERRRASRPGAGRTAAG